MGTKRKYASSNAITKNPISFEMVEEKVKAMQPGRKTKRGAKYNECFLKRDLYHWKFEVR